MDGIECNRLNLQQHLQTGRVTVCRELWREDECEHLLDEDGCDDQHHQ